ncbi:hypothetical protein QJS83_14760 [Bdellovibrio sp. 22V]|uniref:hypothetical protein n=1 Tax=Bdellovibrio sp. 22V TaxID=3044166 RepID=UPI0025429B96|nr:hypothetical protein [Bdellovibrio sp. 22V]WII71724.1 hypothetical protein QJS83_14760 [Bdellovibrio sp. 22V]
MNNVRLKHLLEWHLMRIRSAEDEEHEMMAVKTEDLKALLEELKRLTTEVS